jgi:hypothetical protein
MKPLFYLLAENQDWTHHVVLPSPNHLHEAEDWLAKQGKVYLVDYEVINHGDIRDRPFILLCKDGSLAALIKLSWG